MTTFIALLRGTNVGGYNKIKMAALKQLFVEIGYNDVVTYIQSGNVVFKSNKTSISEIETQIKSAINNHFNYTINVLVISKNELELIFQSNPFLKTKIIDIKALYAILLKNSFTNDKINLLEPYLTNNEKINIVGNCVYIKYPKGAGNSKLTINIIEKKLKTNATSRNWNTITKLVELSNL